MELAFISKHIRDICEKPKLAEEALGLSLSRNLQKRLADLLAVKSVTDIPTGKPTEIDDNPLSNYKVNLDDEYRLVFCSNHILNPVTGGKIDWSKVTYIKILKIEKYI